MSLSVSPCFGRFFGRQDCVRFGPRATGPAIKATEQCMSCKQQTRERRRSSQRRVKEETIAPSSLHVPSCVSSRLLFFSILVFLFLVAVCLPLSAIHSVSCAAAHVLAFHSNIVLASRLLLCCSPFTSRVRATFGNFTFSPSLLYSCIQHREANNGTQPWRPDSFCRYDILKRNKKDRTK